MAIAATGVSAAGALALVIVPLILVLVVVLIAVLIIIRVVVLVTERVLCAILVLGICGWPNHPSALLSHQSGKEKVESYRR